MKQKEREKRKKYRENRGEMKRKLVIFLCVKMSILLLDEGPGLGRLITQYSHTSTATWFIRISLCCWREI